MARGSRLGPCEILTPLREVSRARDMNLNRDVAINMQSLERENSPSVVRYAAGGAYNAR